MSEPQIHTDDEADFVQRARAGEAGAFSALVRRSQAATLAAARAVLGNTHDAEDAVQETYLRAYRRLDSLDPPYHFTAWVRQIIRNVARNMVRRRLHSPPDPAVAARPASAEQLTERVDEAVAALADISPPLREAARLTYLGGHKQADVAQRLNVPLGTVKSRLAHSRRQMR